MLDRAMLDARELRQAIAEFESREASLSTCAKLADLYTVLDHIEPPERDYEREHSGAAGKTPGGALGEYGDSDFLRAVAGKDSAGAWAVMDELMDTLRVVNVRVYDSVMRKVERL